MPCGVVVDVEADLDPIRIELGAVAESDVSPEVQLGRFEWRRGVMSVANAWEQTCHRGQVLPARAVLFAGRVHIPNLRVGLTSAWFVC